MILQHADFQAAATQVRDTACLRFWSKRCEDTFSAQAPFFQRANNFQPNAGLYANTCDECFPLRRFARSAVGYRAVMRYPKFGHETAEWAKRFLTFVENLSP